MEFLFKACDYYYKLAAKNKNWEKIQSISDLIDYAKSNFTFLNKGTGRAAFILNSKQVLKIAFNQTGIDQNREEYNFFHSNHSKFITKIYKHHSNFNWIVADLVRPIKNKEFKDIAGFYLKDLQQYLREIKTSKNFNIEHFFIENNINTVAIPFFNELVDFIQKSRIDDWNSISQWGKTSDGNLVLLDYGFTPDFSSIMHDEEAFKSFNKNIYNLR